MIKQDVDTLIKSPSRGKYRRRNILNELASSVFDAVYSNDSDKPSESEKSITKKTKLRRQRFDEIAKKENIISSELFEKYFGYSSPSDMYKTFKIN